MKPAQEREKTREKSSPDPHPVTRSCGVSSSRFSSCERPIQPSVDFTVVPQLGDKDVDTVLGSVDVIDNLYNTELGVEAATGNFSFGLSYKYGFGKEDRKNQSLNLNARYMF